MTFKLSPCSECGSFLPRGARACPHCQRSVGESILARIPGPLRTALMVGGGGLLSVTLSACYGSPCAGGSCGDYDAGPDPRCTDYTMDTDGDGYCLEHDCDETNVQIYEGAADPLGDSIDQDCDGVDGVAPVDAGM